MCDDGGHVTPFAYHHCPSKKYNLNPTMHDSASIFLGAKGKKHILHNGRLRPRAGTLHYYRVQGLKIPNLPRVHRFVKLASSSSSRKVVAVALGARDRLAAAATTTRSKGDYRSCPTQAFPRFPVVLDLSKIVFGSRDPPGSKTKRDSTS